MERAHRGAERRRHRRVDIDARAEIVVSEGQWMGHYQVENLSAGGGLLVGSPGLQVGERVKIWLHLPGTDPLQLIAEVVRTFARPAGAEGVAAAFRELSADTEDVIQSAVLAALERQVALAI